MEMDIDISTEDTNNIVNDIQKSEEIEIDTEMTIPTKEEEPATEKIPTPTENHEETQEEESPENESKTTVISIDGVSKDITQDVDLDLLYKFKEDRFKDFLVLIKEDDEGNAERLKVLQELGGPINLKCLVMNNIEFIIEVRDGIDPAVTETCITSPCITVFGDAELVPMSTETL